MKSVKAARLGFVADASVREFKKGTQGYMTLARTHAPRFESAQAIWAAMIVVKRGAKPLSRNTVVFDTQEEAEDYCRDIFEVNIDADREKLFLQNISSTQFDRMMLDGFLGKDQIDHLKWGIGPSLDQVVLEEAGVYLNVHHGAKGDCYRNDWLTPKVVNSLGQIRINQLRKNFGSLWSVAAAFEYCWRNYPHSSPAYIAAGYQFHLQISKNLLLAGYLLRDLEIIWENVEDNAAKGARVLAAAKAGGTARAVNAEKQRSTVLQLMTELVNDKGMSPAKASQVLFRQGVGTSEGNNRQIWYRHKPVTVARTVTN